MSSLCYALSKRLTRETLHFSARIHLGSVKITACSGAFSGTSIVVIPKARFGGLSAPCQRTSPHTAQMKAHERLQLHLSEDMHSSQDHRVQALGSKNLTAWRQHTCCMQPVNRLTQYAPSCALHTNMYVARYLCVPLQLGSLYGAQHCAEPHECCCGIFYVRTEHLGSLGYRDVARVRVCRSIQCFFSVCCALRKHVMWNTIAWSVG